MRPNPPRLPRLLAGSACAALVAGALAVVPTSFASAAEPTDGLVLSYDLSRGSGTAVTDLSGRGNTGTIVGGATYADGSLVLDGVDDHVKLPDNLVRGLDSITVDVDVLVDPTQAGNYFLWGLGTPVTSNPWAGNGYLFASGNAFRATASTAYWNAEQNVSAGRNLTRGVFKTVTYTQTGTVGTLYEDGVQVAQNTNVTIRPSQIGGGTTTRNVLGESNYLDDNSLKGRLRSFRVYDRALSAAEVRALAPTDAEQVAADQADIDLGDLSAVTGNLTLPASGPRGTTTSWASSAPGTISATGAVTRPAAGSPGATVTLTATTTRGAAAATRAFTATVPALPTEAQLAAAAADALSLVEPDDVRGNLTLPTTAGDGTTVAWSSSAPAVVSNSGVVERPAAGQGDRAVSLTATITLGATTLTRTYALTVRQLPVAADYEGYAFSYFTGNSIAGEKIYFAASRGNNALQWDQLNNGQPSFQSSEGRRGLRDPFLLRSPEGDTFYLLATDLSVGGGDGFDQRTGSRYLEVWESHDLVNWGKQRHVLVSPPTAGNTWAPEAYWDEASQAYVVYWASQLYPESDPGHTSGSYNRMLIAKTRDFRTFSTPQVWQDPGKSRIDSTVLEEGGTYYRFTKDEGGSTYNCSDIIQEASTSLTAPTVAGNTSWSVQDACIGGKAGTTAVEGPTAFEANPGDTSPYDYYLFVDEYTGRGYIPLGTNTLAPPAGAGVGTTVANWKVPASFTLPSSPRHGTVIPVTAAELARLRATTPYAAPGDPSATRVSGATASTATATWTAPSATNSSAVTGYRVTVRQGSTVVSTQEVTGTTAALTGLPADRSLTVQVEARNAAGYGTPSAATAFRTAAAPVTTTPPVVTPPVVTPPVTPPVSPPVSPLPPVQGPGLPAVVGKVRGKPQVRQPVRLVVKTLAQRATVRVKAAGTTRVVKMRKGRGVLTLRFASPGTKKVVLKTAGGKTVVKVRVRR